MASASDFPTGVSKLQGPNVAPLLRFAVETKGDGLAATNRVSEIEEILRSAGRS